jgi:hypothetical protein
MQPKYPNAVNALIDCLAGAGYTSFEKAYKNIEQSSDAFEKFLKKGKMKLTEEMKTFLDVLKFALLSTFKKIESKAKKAA